MKSKSSSVQVERTTAHTCDHCHKPFEQLEQPVFYTDNRAIHEQCVYAFIRSAQFDKPEPIFDWVDSQRTNAYRLELAGSFVDFSAKDDETAKGYAIRLLQAHSRGEKGLKLFRFPQNYVTYETDGLIAVEPFIY